MFRARTVYRRQRAQIAVGRTSPRASSRTPSSPASTVPGRSAKVCASSLADRERRHAYCIDGQEQETRIRIEQAAAVGNQPRQIFLQPPHLAVGAAAVFGGIEEDTVVAPSAAYLARHELARVVDDPAHRAPPSGRTGERCRGPPRPTSSRHRHGPCARPWRPSRGADPGVAEQVEAFGRCRARRPGRASTSTPVPCRGRSRGGGTAWSAQ